LKIQDGGSHHPVNTMDKLQFLVLILLFFAWELVGVSIANESLSRSVNETSSYSSNQGGS